MQSGPFPGRYGRGRVPFALAGMAGRMGTFVLAGIAGRRSMFVLADLAGRRGF